MLGKTNRNSPPVLPVFGMANCVSKIRVIGIHLLFTIFTRYGKYIRRYSVFKLIRYITKNEFMIYEFLQVFVETLNLYFGNVCELDILYQADKVFMVLEEMVNSSGCIVNTNPRLVVDAVRAFCPSTEDPLTSMLLGSESKSESTYYRRLAP